MFTGIVELLGYVVGCEFTNSNLMLTIQSNISEQLKIDQSVAHQGVCLTVTAVKNDTHTVCAIKETLDKSNLSFLNVGDAINLERCLTLQSRIDGHIVQGHVDGTAMCKEISSKQHQHIIEIEFDKQYAPLLIEKGSICLNGISLTCFDVTDTTCKVAIIPYTWEHTSIQFLKVGDCVNIEFDVLGKYILRNLNLSK
ncbi:MAG: riboflavin synthase [Chitinophagaceae bacterium]